MRGNPACSHSKGLEADIRYMKRMIEKTHSEWLKNILRKNLKIAQDRLAAIEAMKEVR